MTREQFIKNSLELNIFYARIFKEHCVTLAIAQNGQARIQALNRFKVHFEMLLNASLEAGLGLIDKIFIDNNCFVTPYTYSLEQITQNTCGASINYRITNLETERLQKREPIAAGRLPMVYERALKLNSDGEKTAQGLAELIQNILNELSKGKVYSSIYPSVYECYILQLKQYQQALQALKQDKEFDYCDSDAVKIMRICAEHIRGALDPKESLDAEKAHNFALEFAQCAFDKSRFLQANLDFAQFVQELIEKLLAKKLLSVMPPLTFDTVLRQANRNIVLMQK